MGGWHEIRLTGPGREQFRLFCLLENGTSGEIAKRGLPRPAIAVITGMRKPWRTAFSDRDYKHVRDLGAEHQQNYYQFCASADGSLAPYSSSRHERGHFDEFTRSSSPARQGAPVPRPVPFRQAGQRS
jgi:hypothetical protein